MLTRLLKVSVAIFFAQAIACQFFIASASNVSFEKDVCPDINKDFATADKELSRWVLAFENETREIYNRRLEVINSLNLKKGMDVADIGAGTGFYSFLIADAVGAQGIVYAVDIIPAFVKHIRQEAESKNMRQVQPVLGTKKSICLPENSIDVAFLCDTYHHLEYPHNSLASIYQALRPDGRLVIIDLDRRPVVSSEWVLKHVRAGKEVFEKEIESAGFRKLDESHFLKENFMITFVKANPLK